MNKVLTFAGVTLMALLAPFSAFAQSSITVTTEVDKPGGKLAFFLVEYEGWALKSDDQEPYQMLYMDLMVRDRLGGSCAEGNIHSVTFGNLPAGEYGVFAFHDMDGNYVITVDSDEKPLEPIGYSNNPGPKIINATWEQIAFEVADGKHVEISVELIGQ